MMDRNKYIVNVLEKITKKSEKIKIEKELQAHIDDRIEYYENSGYSSDEACVKAMQCMGNPDEIGEELNKVHKPVNKKPIKIVLIIISVYIVFRVITFPFASEYTLYGKYFLNHSADREEWFCAFDISELGEYENYKYRIHHKNIWVFESDASIINAKYSEKEYKIQLDYINSNYSFLQHPIKDETDDYIIPENEFDIGSWHFRVIANDEYLDYPKTIQMIANNDKECRIAYLDFFDDDLDYISEEGDKKPMEKFITEFFSYNFK